MNPWIHGLRHRGFCIVSDSGQSAFGTLFFVLWKRTRLEELRQMFDMYTFRYRGRKISVYFDIRSIFDEYDKKHRKK